MDKREWLLKRNCSLSPRQFFTALVGLCLGLLVFSLPFVILYGAWLVLVFAIMEVAALTAAFLHYARHACDHEHLVLADGSFLVECCEAERVRQIRLEPHWIRVVTPRRYGDLIRLEYGRYAVQIGRFITVEKRRLLAEELRQELKKRV
jgi:uncharacterized membrane protein